MAKKKNMLKNLEAYEVSLVPRGKNLKKFLIRKEMEGNEMLEEILKELEGMKLENEADLDAAIEKAVPEEIAKEGDKMKAIKESVKAVMKIMNGVKKQLPEGSEKLMKELQSLVGAGQKEVSKEDLTTKDFLEKFKGEKEIKEEVLKQLKEEGYNVVEPKKEPESKGGEMDKNTLSEISKMFEEKLKPISKELEDIQKENKSLAAQLKEEKDKNKMSEFYEVAKELGHSGEKAEKVSKILKEANEKLDKESFDGLKETLKASSAQNNASNVFNINKEYGNSSHGDTGAGKEIEAKKAEIMKEDSKLSEYEAELKVFDKHPDLYNKYLNENPAQL